MTAAESTRRGWTAGRIGRAAVGGPERVLAILFAIVLVVGQILEPHDFLNADNLTGVAVAAAIPLLIAVAASVGLLGGVVDLSIGSIAGFTAAIFAQMFNAGTGVWFAVLIAVGSGAVIGVINGVVCVVFGAEPLIATIGAMTALQGLTLVILHDNSQSAFVSGLYDFTNLTVNGIPALFAIVIALAVVASLLLAYTRWGRHVRAVGGDPVASARAGIGVARIRLLLFVLTATFAAVAGVLYVGDTGAAQTTLGNDLALQIYAPILLGGYSLTRGGIGVPLAAVAGVITLDLVANLLDNRSVDPYWQNIITGAVIFLAVYGDRLRGGEDFE